MGVKGLAASFLHPMAEAGSTRVWASDQLLVFISCDSDSYCGRVFGEESEREGSKKAIHMPEARV